MKINTSLLLLLKFPWLFNIYNDQSLVKSYFQFWKENAYWFWIWTVFFNFLYLRQNESLIFLFSAVVFILPDCTQSSLVPEMNLSHSFLKIWRLSLSCGYRISFYRTLVTFLLSTSVLFHTVKRKKEKTKQSSCNCFPPNSLLGPFLSSLRS